jgi:hypothetical protein
MRGGEGAGGIGGFDVAAADVAQQRRHRAGGDVEARDDLAALLVIGDEQRVLVEPGEAVDAAVERGRDAARSATGGIHQVDVARVMAQAAPLDGGEGDAVAARRERRRRDGAAQVGEAPHRAVRDAHRVEIRVVRRRVPVCAAIGSEEYLAAIRRPGDARRMEEAAVPSALGELAGRCAAIGRRNEELVYAFAQIPMQVVAIDQALGEQGARGPFGILRRVRHVEPGGRGRRNELLPGERGAVPRPGGVADHAMRDGARRAVDLAHMQQAFAERHAQIGEAM